MRRTATIIIAGLLMLASIDASAAGGPKQKGSGMTVEQVKAKVAKIGVGEKARATVWLRDGAKHKGYVARTGESEFVLRDRETDAPTTIAFQDVVKLDHNRGHSTARNVALGVGIGAGVVITIVAITFATLD